ncbi:hypothetical protein [Candidatus Nitrospira allomarina]|uniref:Phosphatidate cytidylyltransferase n=1 Tax=Candidatus Nitrospira allomarina TaxID=3020900 RepID=A0AA96GGP1_9BACT|nr:hypothetical protein [Candidatus Nitrospira allomarina]WNM58219.1 hypothetical protein PP769_00230 [Candidatus Nitrospira allomarina]
MDGSLSVLEIVSQPSTRPIPASIQAAGNFLATKYGQAVQGILLYGSCLRVGTDQDGLVDCYVIVDQYASVYPSIWLALLNRWLPPNVFYGEVNLEGRIVRMKYAVLSLEDFERSVTPKWFHSYFWGRFAQPTAVMACPNQAMSQRIILGLGRAVLTFLGNVIPRMPQKFSAKDAWSIGLTLSYGAELRAESKGRIVTLWDSNHAYYEQVAHATFLGNFPKIKVIQRDDITMYEMEHSRWEYIKNRIAWAVRKVQGKVLSVLRLMKAAFTFQGGADYLIWKIERHSGVKIELTPAQRRHPIWAGLTTFWRLYRQGAFR